MSTATAWRPEVNVDMVTTFEIGRGNLDRFLDVVPKPPGRITYRDGSVTIVSPSLPHEQGVDWLDEIVKAIGDELDIDYSPAGSTLYRRDDLERGIMPDRSYSIEHQGAVAGVTGHIDLRFYPPPDLVIEVVWTHGASGALDICRDMRVPEVWLYDVPSTHLQFLNLDPAGSYVPRPRSRAFPFLAPADVLSQIQSISGGEPHNRWKRRLRAWVRDELEPRRAGA